MAPTRSGETSGAPATAEMVGEGKGELLVGLDQAAAGVARSDGTRSTGHVPRAEQLATRRRSSRTVRPARSRSEFTMHHVESLVPRDKKPRNALPAGLLLRLSMVSIAEAGSEHERADTPVGDVVGEVTMKLLASGLIVIGLTAGMTGVAVAQGACVLFPRGGAFYKFPASRGWDLRIASASTSVVCQGSSPCTARLKSIEFVCQSQARVILLGNGLAWQEGCNLDPRTVDPCS